MFLNLAEISPPEELLESLKAWIATQARNCPYSKFHLPVSSIPHASLTVDDFNQATAGHPFPRYRCGVVIRGLANSMEHSERLYFVGQLYENDIPAATLGEYKGCRYVRGFWSFERNSGLVELSNDSSVPNAKTFG